MKKIKDMNMEELAAYYHWDDLQSLEQAVWVAEENEFDLSSIERWSIEEKMPKKFKIFMEKIKKKS